MPATNQYTGRPHACGQVDMCARTDGVHPLAEQYVLATTASRHASKWGRDFAALETGFVRDLGREDERVIADVRISLSTNGLLQTQLAKAAPEECHSSRP